MKNDVKAHFEISAYKHTYLVGSIYFVGVRCALFIMQTDGTDKLFITLIKADHTSVRMLRSSCIRHMVRCYYYYKSKFSSI